MAAPSPASTRTAALDPRLHHAIEDDTAASSSSTMVPVTPPPGRAAGPDISAERSSGAAADAAVLLLAAAPLSTSSSSGSSSSSEDVMPDVTLPPSSSARRLRPLREPHPPTAPRPTDARVGTLYDQSMELHKGPEYPAHYEQPQRIMQVHATLEEQGLLQRCWQLPPRRATDAELLRVHTPQHLQEVASMWAGRDVDGAGAAEQRDQHEGFIRRGADLYVCGDTEAAARMAAGCCVQAVQAVLQGQCHAALAVVRPPGHHAECARAMGFCFYNNCAVAAREALRHPGVERVLVLDWDVHYGNGIAEVLWDDPRVLYVSIHRDPKSFYPFTSGFVDEVGGPLAQGLNINIPWQKRGAGDADYEAAFHVVVSPIVASWRPDLVVVAAGFDAAEGDPLGGCRLTPEGYASMTRSLLRHAGGKLVLCLEGGYNTRVTAECVAACTRVLLEEHPQGPQAPPPPPQGHTGSQGASSSAPAGPPPPAGAEADALAASLSAMRIKGDAATPAGASPSPSPSPAAAVAAPEASDVSTSSTLASRASPLLGQPAVASPPSAASGAAAALVAGARASSRQAARTAAVAAGRARAAAGAAAGAAAVASEGFVVVKREAAQEWPSVDSLRVLKQVCEVQAPFWPVLRETAFGRRYQEWQDLVTARRRASKAGGGSSAAR